MARKAVNVIFVLVFFALTAIPLLNTALGENSRLLVLEKRTVVQPPRFSLDELDTFPRRFETYFNDVFGFRTQLINLHNRLTIKVFKTSPTPKVIVGKDGWLFYRSERSSDGNTIQDYQGLVPYSPRQLRRIKRNIENKTRWFARHGIRFLVVLVPNKETIYREYMPDYIKRGSRTRLDQIDELVRRNPHLPVLNLTKVLMDKKKSTRIYYKGGTHWNQFGAYWGVKAIMRRLENWFPDLQTIPLNAYRQRINPRSSKDHWFGFKEHRFVHLELKPNVQAPVNDYTLLAFRDSFLRTNPHLFRHHFRTYFEYPSRRIEQEQELVVEKQPDIVIWEMVERCSDILLLLK